MFPYNWNEYSFGADFQLILLVYDCKRNKQKKTNHSSINKNGGLWTPVNIIKLVYHCILPEL